MSKAPIEYDFHHSLCLSRGWLKDWPNKQIIIKKVHVRLHQLFENKTPKEQIEMMLNINANVLTKKVRHAIHNILEDEQMIYKEWVWIYK